MAWTIPKTWTTGEALTATDLNTHLRDNLEALKGPPTEHYECDETADYTTTSTSFVDVDATNLELEITTTGGDVLVGFVGVLREVGADHHIYLNVAVDGVDVAADDGFIYACNAVKTPTAFVYLVTDLAAGTHTFTLRWKVESGGSAVIFAGAGTSGDNIHPQFWVREV